MFDIRCELILIQLVDVKSVSEMYVCNLYPKMSWSLSNEIVDKTTQKTIPALPVTNSRQAKGNKCLNHVYCTRDHLRTGLICFKKVIKLFPKREVSLTFSYIWL